MRLCLLGNDFHFEAENICRLFLPQEKIETVYELPREEEGITAVAAVSRTAEGAQIAVTLTLSGFHGRRERTVPLTEPEFDDACELTLATLLYELFVELFGYTQSWGVLTGVRPIKLLRRLTRERGEEAALAYFHDRLLVSDSKRALAAETLHHENAILALSRPESFSLYLSVPFCPTRCDYCSFVSHTTERSARLIPTYVELLQREIEETARIARELSLRLETVYMGGGTPTTLSAEQMAAVLSAAERCFDCSSVREFTVEAGRPDTVTEDKLRAIRAAGVSRISINPQTLHDRVLSAIGRRHTVEEFYNAFELARRLGFDHINTDLIAGLPTDTAEGFSETLSGILALSPESVTVHTLCRKRASQLVVRGREDIPPAPDAIAMVAESAERLPQAGYHPYYLYRQSRTVGNQENVGWAKEGHDGLYNVFIMDETHSILGCGAGAVTKLKDPHSEYLERVFNYKFPYEYNDRFGEMLLRKQKIRPFYEGHPIA